MCGIAGVISQNRACLNEMLDKIKHRGPDASGIFELPEFGGVIGHVRLGIIDLDKRSNQPFISSCGNYVLSFNGEIYNYKALKEELKCEGYEFRTDSDTEVLLNWLIAKGESGISQLDGMFAFCFVNRNTKKMLLVRDHIGEKTVFYSYRDSGRGYEFAFSSEINSLLAVGWIDRSLNQSALQNYLKFLYTPAPDTLYKGVKELEPGQVLTIDITASSISKNYFYNLVDRVNVNYGLDYLSAVSGFSDKFKQSIKLRLQSDVPLGIYLSGGMDSNSIAAACVDVKLPSELHSFTMDYGVAEGHFNETALAKSASAVYGIKNSTVSFVENNSFEQSIRRTVELFGVPFGNSTALSADKMAQRVAGTHKVCLVGDGGDEILIGYPRYKAILHHQRYSQLPKWLILIASQMSGLVPEKGGSATTIRRAKQFISNLNVPVGEAFLEWSTYLNNESISRATGSSFKSSFYDGLLDVFNIYGFDPILAASIVDLKSFVPYNLMQCADRTSMAHSLELRSPFLSTELIEYSLSIPSALKMKKGRTKPLLVDSLGEKLPEIIRNQPKRGFNPPLASFLNENMRALEDELVGNNSSLKNEIDLEFIKEEINAFKVGKRDNSTFLWGLSSLSSWLAT